MRCRDLFFRAIYEGKKASSMVVFFPPPSVFPDNHSGNSKRAAGAKNFERNHRRNSWKRLQNTRRLLFKIIIERNLYFIYLFIFTCQMRSHSPTTAWMRKLSRGLSKGWGGWILYKLVLLHEISWLLQYSYFKLLHLSCTLSWVSVSAKRETWSILQSEPSALASTRLISLLNGQRPKVLRKKKINATQEPRISTNKTLKV